MIEREAKEELEKEGYRIIGKHSAVKICRWTKKSLIDEGVCYKQKFYGIDSHRCCQMSCTLFHCENKCIHCWRNLKYTKLGKVKNPDDPKKIIDACISKQKKLLMGFKGNDNVNMKKFEEAQEPMQFAISLIGEALNYPKIGEFIYELTKRGKTSFLVSNGLNASVLQELGEKDCLPTQLYISMNVPDKELFDRWHNSSVDSAWDKFIGLGIGTELGLIGALFHVLNHAIMKSTLFFCAGIMIAEAGTREIKGLSGFNRQQPAITFAFVIASLGMIGIPPINGFASKLLICLAAIEAGYTVLVVIILVASAISAAYYFRVIQVLFSSPLEHSPIPTHGEGLVVHRGNFFRAWPIYILTAGCLLLGLIPALGISLVKPAVGLLLSHVVP